MSATISDASQSASGATDCRLMVQLPGLSGHADNVEFDVTAERMPLEREGHPPLDLIEGCRGFCKKLIEIHLHPPLTGSARPWRRTALPDYCWDGFG